MVVAGQNGAYGLEKKQFRLKNRSWYLQHCHVCLARRVGKLPVTVFAMDNQVKQVDVTVKINGLSWQTDH